MQLDYFRWFFTLRSHEFISSIYYCLIIVRNASVFFLIRSIGMESKLCDDYESNLRKNFVPLCVHLLNVYFFAIKSLSFLGTDVMF